MVELAEGAGCRAGVHHTGHGHPHVWDALGDAGNTQKDHADHSSQIVVLSVTL